MGETPLTEFLATLANPLSLESFRADPGAFVSHAKLPADLAQLILEGHPGAIRVRAVQELERAGLSPLVSDKFHPDAVAQQPMNTTTYNVSMNSYTSSTYTSYTYTSNTYTTNTII